MWVEVSKHKVFIKIFTQVEHISKWRSTSTCAIGIANTSVDFKTLYKIKNKKEWNQSITLKIHSKHSYNGRW
jgi:hypothetical protein